MNKNQEIINQSVKVISEMAKRIDVLQKQLKIATECLNEYAKTSAWYPSGMGMTKKERDCETLFVGLGYDENGYDYAIEALKKIEGKNDVGRIKRKSKRTWV